MAEITEKPIRDAIRTGSLVHVNLGKAKVDFKGVDDKIGVVVVSKVRQYIDVQFRKIGRDANEEVVN